MPCSLSYSILNDRIHLDNLPLCHDTHHFHEQEEQLIFELTERQINLPLTAVTILAGSRELVGGGGGGHYSSDTMSRVINTLGQSGFKPTSFQVNCLSFSKLESSSAFLLLLNINWLHHDTTPTHS